MSDCILRNTLLSEHSLETVLSLPVNQGLYASLLDHMTRFQEIKKFASEIHTEIHLVKPILKGLGFIYESKPKFYEEHVKDPDVALYVSEEERVNNSPLWGTREYYGNTLGIVLLKRYGRNLHEGISGFYLEFENKMPIYQMFYLLKKSGTPWGMLTNGKQWILMRRPVQFEERVFEVDLERAVFEGDEETVHLFCQVFSCVGLKKMLPGLIDEERETLLDTLTKKRKALHAALGEHKKKVDFYPTLADAYREFFSGWPLPATEAYLKDRDITVKDKGHPGSGIINGYDHADILSYLFSKRGGQTNPMLEQVIMGEKNRRLTKEDLFSFKILDITPGFGNLSAQLIDGLAYISFLLPYREKNTFRVEWEEESALKKYIIDNILFGIERSHVSLDILKNSLASRFGAPARNYRLGNPLIGMPLKSVATAIDSTNQMGLFNKHPKEVIDEFKEMYTRFFSLSDKIKEDLLVRNEMKAQLAVYTDRIRDVMDVMTATYFTKTVEARRIQDMLFSLDGSGASWDALEKQGWFIEAKDIAKRNGFFHLEIEFPFLLHSAFDYIFVQPSLNYAWEEDLPVAEATKAFIKRGMMYLKQEGKLVLIPTDAIGDLAPELKKSKRFEVDFKDGLCILKKKI